MSTKRKQIVVSMEDKLNAIRRLEKGKILQKVADDYGVGWVTVGDWKKNKEQIENGVLLEFVSTNWDSTVQLCFQNV